MEVLLENCGKKFGSQWIFRNLNLQISSGDRVAVIGSNGSGKSTLIGCISSYLLCNEGRIQYLHNGKNLSAETACQQMAWVAPAVELPEELTVDEFFHLHFSFKGRLTDAAKFENWLERAGLKQHTQKSLRQLSSGMKQRVKLLSALHADCSLILLDEPTTNFDEEGTQLYLQLIEEITRGRTLIVGSNMPREYAFCEKTIEMGKKKTG